MSEEDEGVHRDSVEKILVAADAIRRSVYPYRLVPSDDVSPNERAGLGRVAELMDAALDIFEWPVDQQELPEEARYEIEREVDDLDD